MSPVATTASERVVGIPSACIASLMMYSRKAGPSAHLPSPLRENGVRPEPPIAQLRRKMAELMAGVGLGDRLGTFRHQTAGQCCDARRGCQRRRVCSEFAGQFLVQADQGRLACRRRLPENVELLEVADIGVVKGKKAGRWGVHRNWALQV